jgi:hypothetical protein
MIRAFISHHPRLLDIEVPPCRAGASASIQPCTVALDERATPTPSVQPSRPTRREENGCGSFQKVDKLAMMLLMALTATGPRHLALLAVAVQTVLESQRFDLRLEPNIAG